GPTVVADSRCSDLRRIRLGAAAATTPISTATTTQASRPDIHDGSGVVFSSALRYLIALVRRRHIRKTSEERLVIFIDAVAEQVVWRLIRQPQRSVQDGAVALGERSQLDIDDIVFKPPAIWEASEITRENTEPVPGAH